MHGDGVCCWSNGIALGLAFTHCYPNHVRSAVRVLCGILLLCTLVYVMPHLVDMTSASATPSEMQFSQHTTGAAYGADGQHCDYIVREAPPVSLGCSAAAAAAAPPLRLTRCLRLWLASQLSTRVYELFQWPWAWLWPWSTQQLEARAQARHEALILAMGGLKGVHIKGLWGASDSADVREGAPTGCMDTSLVHRDSVDRVLAMTPRASGAGHALSAARDGDAPDDDEDFDDSDDGLVGAASAAADGAARNDGVWGDQDDDSDDDMLREAYTTGVFDPASFFDDGSDLVPAASFASPSNVSGPRVSADVEDGTCGPTGCRASGADGDGRLEHNGAVGDAGVYSDVTAAGAADGFTDDLPGGSDEEDGGSTILTVLTLYLRLHLKRQLHYLRLGMLALFTLTGRSCRRPPPRLPHVHGWPINCLCECAGDLEDAMSAVVWPLLCIVSRTCSNRRFMCGRQADRPLFWVALTVASSAVAFICVFVVVVVPEAVAEVVRLSCMNGLVAVPVDAAGDTGSGVGSGTASGLL